VHIYTLAIDTGYQPGIYDILKLSEGASMGSSGGVCHDKTVASGWDKCTESQECLFPVLDLRMRSATEE